MIAQAKGHRFPILITQFARVLMIPFGVSRRRAFAQLHDGELHVRFGPMFDERIPLDNIEGAEVSRWPRWAGVGPRTDFRGRIGLVGSYSNTVKLTLKDPIDVHLFVLGVTCRKLYLSLEDPDAFVREVSKPRAKRPEVVKAA
jgi:hypothetical protein